MPWTVRAFGIRSNSSAVTLCAIVTFDRSICLDVSAVTLTISLTVTAADDGARGSGRLVDDRDGGAGYGSLLGVDHRSDDAAEPLLRTDGGSRSERKREKE
jgi:hypothetical protein